MHYFAPRAETFVTQVLMSTKRLATYTLFVQPSKVSTKVCHFDGIFTGKSSSDFSQDSPSRPISQTGTNANFSFVSRSTSRQRRQSGRLCPAACCNRQDAGRRKLVPKMFFILANPANF